MAALTTAVHHEHKGNLDKWKIGVKAIGADTFYAGALVYADVTSGKAQVTAATGGNWADTDKFIGICAKTTVVTAADQLVEIYTGGLWSFLCDTTPVEGDVGDVLCMEADTLLTDNPADLATGAAAGLDDGDPLIGKIIAIDARDSNYCWVAIDPGWNYEATGVLGWV